MPVRAYFVVLVVLAAALLAGCGSSSKTSSSPANASAATTTPAAKPPATRSPITTPALKHAFTKFATCMRANGVNFPLPNTSGKGPIFSAKGVDIRSAKYKAASTKCRGDLLNALRAHRGSVKTPSTAGSTPSTAGSTPSTAGSPSSATQTKPSPTPPSTVSHIKRAATPAPVTAALEHFTACMHEHGVTNFPEPEGAGFNVSHVNLNRSSAQFKAAEKKCNPILNAIA